MDGDACTIILPEFEPRRARTRVRSFEVLAVVAAIVRRFILALVLVLASLRIFTQNITRRTLASVTRAHRGAQMRTGRIGTRIGSRAGKTVALQKPAGRALATVARVSINAPVRAFMVILVTLVNVLTLTIVVRPESTRAYFLAGEAIPQKTHVLRTSTFETSGNIDTLVRTSVLEALVEILTSPSVLL